MRKEDKSVLIGVVVAVILSLTLYLLIEYELVLSVVVGLIAGVSAGLIADRSKVSMGKKLDLLMRIVGWSLMIAGFLLLLLMATGILHSPSEMLIVTLINAGIFLELGRTEAKLSLLWTDFMKRKIDLT